MSDTHTWNGGDPAEDPFAPDVVEASITRFLRPDTPSTPHTTPHTQLVRTLADAYALPHAVDAALARSRATLARRAEALRTGEHQMSSSDTWPAPTRSITQPPQPPRRRLSPFETFLRTAAAVLVIALLGAGFYTLLHGMQRQGTKPQPTPTHPPVSSTATPNAPTSTTVPSQLPAPAGVYVTAPSMLFLIAPSTGAIQQRYSITSSGQAVVGAPVVANGVVYFTYASTVSPRESDVVALSASTGAQLWRTQTVSGLTQLLLAGGTLYGGTEGTSTGSDTFYALRASDGSVLWTFHTPTLRPPAVVTGGVVYLMDQPANSSVQHVHALRAADGTHLWDAPLPQACGIALQAVADQGMVFVGCGAQGDYGQGGNGSVYGLRASDGTVVWHVTTNGEPNSGLAVGAGLVYVSPGGKTATGANASGLYALDEPSGAVRWQVLNGDGWPVFDGTTVYAGLDSSLTAFSASSGTVLWTYPWANQRVEANAPVIAGGVVYEILNEQAVAISAANGSALWRSPTLGSQQQGLGGLSVVTGG